MAIKHIIESKPQKIILRSAPNLAGEKAGFLPLPANRIHGNVYEALKRRKDNE
jgi:hypothetical protein